MSTASMTAAVPHQILSPTASISQENAKPHPELLVLPPQRHVFLPVPPKPPDDQQVDVLKFMSIRHAVGPIGRFLWMVVLEVQHEGQERSIASVF